MNLFKKLIAIGLTVFCMGGSIATAASANGFHALNNAIRAAQARYDEACNALQAANPELYKLFVARICPDEEYYRIEAIYNAQYGREYFEYLSAKVDLDDMLYLNFMASMNDVSNKISASK